MQSANFEDTFWRTAHAIIEQFICAKMLLDLKLLMNDGHFEDSTDEQFVTDLKGEIVSNT